MFHGTVHGRYLIGIEIFLMFLNLMWLYPVA
jgi:hypothetical protein